MWPAAGKGLFRAPCASRSVGIETLLQKRPVNIIAAQSELSGTCRASLCEGPLSFERLGGSPCLRTRGLLAAQQHVARSVMFSDSRAPAGELSWQGVGRTANSLNEAR